MAPNERAAHRAWAAAKRLRKAAQDRIVCAFRKQIEGSSSGPADTELLMFARREVSLKPKGNGPAAMRGRSVPPQRPIEGESTNDCYFTRRSYA
jgi:hypothetical protein